MARRKPPEPVFADGCIYQPDPDVPPAPGEDPVCVCHLPKRHPRHGPGTAHAAAAQDEHRRRIGDDP